jgi:hypothetical protein
MSSRMGSDRFIARSDLAVGGKRSQFRFEDSIFFWCAFRKSYPDVTVVQSRQDWDGYNDPGPLDCPT